jgi:hypothetical protein
VNNEKWVPHLITRSGSGPEDRFRDGVRARDKKCVISGLPNPLIPANMWVAFETTHVFPLASEGIWQEFDYGRYITNMDDAVGISKMNSTQNGLLMTSTMHKLFDQYLFSINPDVCVLSFPKSKQG